MVKRLSAFAGLVVDLVAAVFVRRATLVEVAGFACLVMFASTFGARWAWGLAGVGLTLKSLELDQRLRATPARRAQREPRRRREPVVVNVNGPAEHR